MHENKAYRSFKKKEISLLGSSNSWRHLYVQQSVLKHGNVLTGNIELQNCPTPAPPPIYCLKLSPSSKYCASHTYTHTHTHTHTHL